MLSVLLSFFLRLTLSFKFVRGPSLPLSEGNVRPLFLIFQEKAARDSNHPFLPSREAFTLLQQCLELLKLSWPGTVRDQHPDFLTTKYRERRAEGAKRIGRFRQMLEETGTELR